MSPDPESHEYDPRLFCVPLGKSQAVEPNITFLAGTPTAEVMRIDRHGVKVNPEYTVDEATQHVLNALSAHIQRTVNHAVDQERESCAKVCEAEADATDAHLHMCIDALRDCADAIRARGQS